MNSSVLSSYRLQGVEERDLKIWRVQCVLASLFLIVRTARGSVLNSAPCRVWQAISFGQLHQNTRPLWHLPFGSESESSEEEDEEEDDDDEDEEEEDVGA